MSPILTILLLVLLTTHEGMSVGNPGDIQRCKCIQTQKKPIGRLIGMVQVYAVNSHCNVKEIIATLKKSGKKVCLDPEAPWVQKVLQRKKPKQTP
ncbi:growth-regulated alpha protein-like [Parambassis ranga]|uniref:Growth-regulated alpha protein-like n=1 Tax=Parambassis ranga TaxID=210632 RepID=A0A6P7IY89_9TELE|nr:growth-regulated alpha protein-like [Parambassis ranga]